MECCKTKKRTENEKKQIISRINRIQGQLNGIKNMIESDKYCNDVLVQLLAVEKATRSLSNLILENHFQTCLISEIQNNNLQVVDETLELLRRFEK